MSIKVLASHRAHFHGTFSDRLTIAKDHDSDGRRVRYVDLWAFGWRVMWAVH